MFKGWKWKSTGKISSNRQLKAKQQMSDKTNGSTFTANCKERNWKILRTTVFELKFEQNNWIYSEKKFHLLQLSLTWRFTYYIYEIYIGKCHKNQIFHVIQMVVFVLKLLLEELFVSYVFTKTFTGKNPRRI